MNRAKGQDVELITVVNGAPVANMTYIRNFEVTWDLEILSEDYLGHTTTDFDSIFKGVSGGHEFHFDSPEVFNLIDAIVSKARARTPGTVFNIKASINFPSGRRGRIIVPDVEFGAIPLNFGGRSEFGSIKVDWKASEAKIWKA